MKRRTRVVLAAAITAALSLFVPSDSKSAVCTPDGCDLCTGCRDEGNMYCAGGPFCAETCEWTWLAEE